MAKQNDGIRFGAKSGKPFIRFVSDLIGANAKRKLSDDELVAVLAKEFPARFNQRGFQRMSAYRSYYNQGLHGMGSNPGKPSKPQVERFGGPQETETKQPWKAMKIDRRPNGEGGKEAKAKKAKAKGKAKKAKAKNRIGVKAST